MANEDTQPAWLDASKDELDEATDFDETTPLFGTGPVPPDDTPEDVETPETYGGVDEQKEDTLLKQDDKWHEDKKKPAKKSKPSKGRRDSLQDFLNRPPKPCFLHIFHFVETVAVIGCCCLLATQLIPLFILPVSEIGYLQMALRAYLSLFCVAFILVEWNAPLPFLRDSRILQTYFSRGFLYTFVGLIGMEEAFGVMVEDKLVHAKNEFSVSWASLFMELSSWLIVTIGCIYCLFGLFCLQTLRQKLADDWREKVKAYDALRAAEMAS